MECTKCGELVDRSMFGSDVSFCPYCGQNLKIAPPPINLAYCPYCGQELIAGARFCPSCGKNLVVKNRKKAQPQAYSGYTAATEDYNEASQESSVIKKGFDSVTRALTYAFSPERKMRRLYGQWAEYADLSPEEIQALEAQTEMSDEWKKREKMLKTAVLAGIGLIIVILIAALLIIYVF